MGDTQIKYWLHRISHEWDVSYKLLSEGYLTIGWSNLTLTDIIASMGNTVDTPLFEKVMEEQGYHSSRSRWNLWYFFSFSAGDIVVVPLFSGEFSIYKIIGKAIRITDLPGFDSLESDNGSVIKRDSDGFFIREDGTYVDLGFAIKVEPIREHISRYEYADNALTSRMKIRQTNADISDLKENVQNVINAKGPVNLYAGIIEELSEKLLDAISSQLTPDKFELLVKWYFQKLGASKTFRPAKNESGKSEGADADIIAEFDALKIVFYVQAKLHDNVTSQWAVEQISKYKDQHENAVGEYTIIPWVVSSAKEFSSEAVTQAQNNNVRLITGLEFSRMLIDSGITDINKAFE